MPALIAACDVFVLPSFAEPFGLVLLEAMAMGKPVVATRAGGPMEIVDDERTGLLVGPRDPNELARAVLRLLGEPEMRRTMGQYGLARFNERFTAQRMALDTKAVYEKVLGGRQVKSICRSGKEESGA